ncbi:DNA -binding domain-containing protein [Propylenella binzhouense]|uniref:DNA -binding domain-containing protein n=1 Tax=Propylenella binzhouense TaxID=2555902 RepID=UPI001371DBEB
MFWSPETDPGTVILGAWQAISTVDSIVAPAIDAETSHTDSDGGVSLTLGRGLLSIHVLLLPGIAPGQRVIALLPLGTDGLDRIEAIARLWRMAHSLRLLPDARITVQQRRRLRRMLQAVDGHSEGASYRQIAEAIYGQSRVSETPWKTSALRDATIDLVKDGLALIAGDYRSLLKRRRRL